MKTLRTARRSLSIGGIVICAFIGTFLVTVIGIGILIFSNWNASVERETYSTALSVNQDIAEKVDYFVGSTAHINGIAQSMIEGNAVDMTDEDARNRFFLGVLSSYDQNVYSFSYGSEQGEYYGARRNADGKLEIMKNNLQTGGQSWYYAVRDDLTVGEQSVNAGLFDPRTRQWYTTALQEKGPAFSPVYKHFVMDDLTVSVSQPVYSTSGTLRGVLGTHMLLSDIGDYLKNAVAPYDGIGMIIESDSQYLIANSEQAPNYQMFNSQTPVRQTAYSLKTSILQAICQRYRDTGETRFALEDTGQNWYVNIQPYQRLNLEWLIVSAVPSSPMAAELYRNIHLTAFMAGGATILSLVYYSLLIRKLFQPANELLAAGAGFAAGNLERRAAVARNDEIGMLAEVFNHLADQMQLLINHLEDTVAQRTAELHQANEILLERQSQLRLILDTAAEAIFGTNLDGGFTFCNQSCLRLLRYSSPQELLGKTIFDLIGDGESEDPGTRRDISLGDYLSQGKNGRAVEALFWRSDGSRFDAEWRALPQLKNDKHIGYVITFVDISERKKDEEKIRFLSCHDSLTGLVNRSYFEAEMKRLDTGCSLPLSLIFTDLNGLKLINDTFGHAAGDEFFVKVARILKESRREKDVVARIGGDEFAVLLPGTSYEDAQAFADQLRQKVAAEKVCMVSCSMAVGAATKTKFHQRLEQVLELAENEMYQDKTASSRQFGSNAIQGILSTLHEKFPREKQHSQRVSELCEAMGVAMGLSEPKIKVLRDAGYMHDIGKITLQETTLIGKGSQSLTEIETEMMRQHAAAGYRILNLSQETLDLAQSVYFHHECWDGSGYPKGLKGAEIPLISRIISVSEAFERTAGQEADPLLGRQKALQVLTQGSGREFDPYLVQVLIDLVSTTK